MDYMDASKWLDSLDNSISISNTAYNGSLQYDTITAAKDTVPHYKQVSMPDTTIGDYISGLVDAWTALSKNIRETEQRETEKIAQEKFGVPKSYFD